MGNLCTYIQFSYEPKSVLRKLNIKKKNYQLILGSKLKICQNILRLIKAFLFPIDILSIRKF